MKMRPVSSEIREVMDIRQASEYLGISPDTLYKYASEGSIPAFKLGNRWRFKRSRLDEWMDEQSTASLARAPRAAEPARAVGIDSRKAVPVEDEILHHPPAPGRGKPPLSVRPRQKRPSRLVN